MIRYRTTVFVDRCHSCGVTLEEVQDCIVSDHGDGTLTVDTNNPSFPRLRKGFGDRVADGLAAVGITKERVTKIVGKDCGCKKRQEALNELGQRAAEAVRKLTGQDAQHATPEQKRPVDD